MRTQEPFRPLALGPWSPEILHPLDPETFGSMRTQEPFIPLTLGPWSPETLHPLGPEAFGFWKCQTFESHG